MSPDAWSLLDGRAERAKRSWPETTAVLPVGERVRASVLATMPFGVFVEIDGQPDALGLVEITTLPRGSALPSVGVYLNAVVVGHAAHNWQVRLRPADAEVSG
ncbi:hypothetical protein OG994_28200 [Micromonospora globbae]|uniref:S1 motif domain-containing protein n=1 Tax=Micromonospora globbae TaxID=1894969 RepID=A0ABZ1S5U9_9ACTN|nr:hypothetical protein [Micromonospora globbae]